MNVGELLQGRNDAWPNLFHVVCAVGLEQFVREEWNVVEDEKKRIIFFSC